VPSERTLILVKPDAFPRGLTGEIIARFERKGLRLVALRHMTMGTELAQEHYAEHEGKPFYEGLLKYITSAPVILACIEGTSAVQMVRNTVGATNPLNAAPGTIRGDYALDIGRNLIHASDAPATAERELALWFSDPELVAYDRDTDPWIFE